jgi:N-acetylmuramoyl-L-alanine amidase
MKRKMMFSKITDKKNRILYALILAVCVAALGYAFLPGAVNAFRGKPAAPPAAPPDAAETDAGAPAGDVAESQSIAPPEAARIAQPPPQYACVPPDSSAAMAAAPADAAAAAPETKPGKYPPNIIVCVDPGHPSEVHAGRVVQNGVTELDMNWAVAQQLIPMLRDAGISVVSTKEEKDEMVTNRRRSEICNKAGAVIFLRLHCDTGAESRSGFTVYYPDGKGKKEGRTGPTDIVLSSSKSVAQTVHDGMAELLTGKLKDNGIKGESKTAVGAKQGALTGSIFAEMPGITVEMVFLSNPGDAKFISSPAGQKTLAAALAQGVFRYLELLN